MHPNKIYFKWKVVNVVKIKFITLEDLLEMKTNEEDFKLVEVLSEDSFKKGHIPGAINIPVGKLDTEADKKLEKTDKIVVYCSSYSCHASTNAAKTLLEMGYENVLDFKTGKKGWSDAGLHLET